MSKLRDLTGQKFNRLLIIKRAGSNEHKKALWLCRCDCGEIITAIGSEMLSGHTNSCGCLRSERVVEVNSKHGEAKKTLEYRTWQNIKTRCSNPQTDGYHRYGGRGISVCDRWKDSFENFLEDMGRCPIGKTIERKDNDMGYDPDNCKWASRKCQSRNKSNNHHVTFKGRAQIIAEWAEEIGVLQQSLRSYLNNGHTMEEAIEYYNK